MVLSRSVLTPVSSGIKNPLAMAIAEAEEIVKRHEDYYYHKWPEVKKKLVSHALHLETYGSFLNGAATTAPNVYISEVIDDLRNLIQNCYYFSSQYWRAFYYWLDKGGKFNARWPQFEKEEAELTVSVLDVDQLSKAASLAKTTWPDSSKKKEYLEKMFKQIQGQIARLCWLRLRFLSQYDPAIYSPEDLQQMVNAEMLLRLRKNDCFDDKPAELMGWSIRCADNIIHNIRNYAQASKRAKIIRIKNDGLDGDQFLVRECALDEPLQEGGESNTPITLADSIRLLGDTPFEAVDSIQNHTLYNELMNKADFKIKKYLQILWGDQHSPEFWTWFVENQPSLAKREAYTKENPEAIGPFVQRWLELPKHQLVDFLRQHIPSIQKKFEEQRSNL